MKAPESTEARDAAELTEYTQATEAVGAVEVEVDEVLDESAMVDALRRYRRVRDELDIQKRRAKEYLEQVKAETEEDLAPLEARLQGLRDSMQTFIESYNAGKKFKCPGLGTVYTSRGFGITVSDEQALMVYVESELPGEYLERVFPRKLSLPAVKRLAGGELQETGEQIPGIQAEPTVTLNVRLLKSSAATEQGDRF